MALHSGAGRGPGHTDRGPQGAPPALESGIVTGVEVLGDIAISIAAPSAQSVPMQTNGSTIRISTSGSADIAAVDTSKITLSVSDQGSDTGKNQVAVPRTIKIRSVVYKPYAEQATVYQPSLGEFYLKLDDYVFHQDATWKTTVVAVNFAAGWLPGQPASRTASVTRSDSLSYFPTTVRPITAPYQRVAPGSTLPVELDVGNHYARAKSQVACVEAWLTEKNSAVGGSNTGGDGPKALTSAMALSKLTPSGSTPGKPTATYQLDLDPTGLAANRVEWRWKAYPWIGPPVDSASQGDTWPCVNPPVGVPACLDLDSSWSPLYVCLAYDPAVTPAGKSAPIQSGSVSTVDVSGVSTTAAGAIASGKVYEPAFGLLAVQRVNAAVSNLTIADPVSGSATFSYKRATPHNDHAAAVLLCEPVAGSTPGFDAGAYSVYNDMSAGPDGLVMATIRSSTGAVDNAVRWRGKHNNGTTTGNQNRTLPWRCSLEFLYLDSTGTTVTVEEIIFNQTNQTSQASQPSEVNGAYLRIADCKIRNDNAAGTNGPVVKAGLQWHERLDWSDQVAPNVGAPAVYCSGLVSSIGCSYTRAAFNSQNPVWAALFGAKLVNLGGFSQGPTGLNQPIFKSRMFSNVEIELGADVGSNSPWVAGGSLPILNGEHYRNLLVWGADTDMTASLGFMKDSNQATCDGMMLQHVAAYFPQAVATALAASQTPGSGRFNIGYNDNGVGGHLVRMLTRGIVNYQQTTKGDSFPGPETVHGVGATSADPTTVKFYAGNFVEASSVGYEAKQDVPIGTTLNNTSYWRNLGTSTTAFGAQSQRQGNSDYRYKVGCQGSVKVISGDGAAPGPSSWSGYAWDDGNPAAVWDNLCNDMAGHDFTPKPDGELVDRVPFGMAVCPIDLNGVSLLNDGSDAAGPLQIPH